MNFSSWTPSIFKFKVQQPSRSLFAVILGILVMVSSCSHDDLRSDIESELQSKEKLGEAKPAMPYSQILGQLELEQQKKISLHLIQTDLTEDLVLLDVRRQNLSHLLADELLKSPYNSKKIKEIMRLYVENSKHIANLRLRAMLSANIIIRKGLSEAQLKRAQTTKEAIFKL